MIRGVVTFSVTNVNKYVTTVFPLSRSPDAAQRNPGQPFGSQRDREEIHAACKKVTPVSDHLRVSSRIALCSIRATRFL
jgi:hypothetical protein